MADKKTIDGFIAVRMPAGVRKRLESVSKALREAGVSGEWQEEGTHHLTLKYIGQIGSEKYDEIAEALREPCGALSLPAFTVGPLFTFEAHNGNTVLAARVTPKDDLERLFRVLERVAVKNGAEKSKFPSFKPHVTLCYLDDKEDWRRAKAEIAPPDEFGELTIATVPLNESGEGQDFRIRRTVRVGRSRAFHNVWAILGRPHCAAAPPIPGDPAWSASGVKPPVYAGGGPLKVTPPASSFPSAKATEATCPHCDWSPVSKGDDGSFRCPTCTMRFWPSGEGPNQKKKKKTPKEGTNECAKCGQRIMAHGEANEAEDGKVYCGDCYDGNFAWCDSCEKELRKGGTGTTEIDGDWFCKDCPPPACDNCSKDVHPGQTFCEECYDENCVTCDECPTTMLKENAIYAFDTWFCEDHRPDSCDSCEEYITPDESYSVDGGMWCPDCYERVKEQMVEEQWADFYASHPKLEEIDALRKAADEDEDGMTPDIYAKIFNDMEWGSSYGGKAWGHIAETWRDLARASDSEDWTTMLVLTDHAFDLAHNNGSLFTKAKPEVREWLFKALEEKYFRDPLEYRDKLSADARKLLDAHIRYNAGGLAKWKEHMDGRAGAMGKVEKAIVNDPEMARRLWEAFDLSVPMFTGRDSFLDVAFWSSDEYSGHFIASDIREFMRAGDPDRLTKIMTELPPAKCKPGSSHPAASFLWDKFVPKAIEVVERTPGMREKMRESPAWYKSIMSEWDDFIQSAKRRRREDREEKSLATAIAAAFLKIALNRTDFYDFYALTVVDCDGLPDDMAKLCHGLKKVTLIQVSDAIAAILRRAVVREARHVQHHVGSMEH